MTATSIDAGSAQRRSLRAGAFELSDVVDEPADDGVETLGLRQVVCHEGVERLVGAGAG